MLKVLKGGAYGPDGDYVPAGQAPADDWPEWFLADLNEHEQLIDAAVSVGGGERVALRGSSSRGRKDQP